MPRVLIAALLAALACTPVLADEFLWIEGESSANSSFNQHGWYQNDANIRADLMSPGVPETADGAWLAHYVSGDPTNSASASFDFSVTEGGTYAWWIRLNPVQAVYRFSLDGGPVTDLDVSDFREQLNLVGPIDDPGIDIRWLAWIRAAELDLTAGPHTLRVEVAYHAGRDASHGGLDCLVLINYPWEPAGVLQPDQVIQAPGSDVWFPLRSGDDPFSPESITDMSGLLQAPAGRHGPLRRVGAGFEFRDDPAVQVKFWGTNIGNLLATESMQRRQARTWAKYGINLVRFHPLQGWLGVLGPGPGGSRILDAARLEVFDRWFAIIKEQGIYLDVSAFYPHVVTPDDGYPGPLYDELPDRAPGKSSSGMVGFMTQLQDAEWEWLRTLLEHVNPHTGLAYKDDPALAIVEVHNEDSVFWHAPLNDLGSATGPYPLHRAELQRQWMEWVAARYGDDPTLAAAWGAGLRPGDLVTNPAMDIYGAWQMTAEGPDWGAGPDPDERPRLGDFIRFLAETQRASYERRLARLRGLGYEAAFVTSAWRAGGAAAQAANMWCDDAGDAIDRHAYWGGGGTQSWRVTRGGVNNGTHLGQPGRGILAGHLYDSAGEPVVLYQVEDKPVIMSEWTSSPPNQWKAEIAPLWAFYGMGLQGWDASLHFAASRPRMGSGWPWNAWSPGFYVTETPHYMGQFPALVFAIQHGHFGEGPVVAARRLALDDIFSGIDTLSRDLPGGGWPAEPNLSTPPEVMAIGRVTFKAADGLPASAKTDWTSSWNQAQQTILSSTGELLWDYGLGRVLLMSEKTQGLVGRSRGVLVDLPGVQLQTDTEFVSLLFTPLDDRPLLDSEHILITALARDIQLGGLYSADGSQLLQVGGPPLLLEPVQASITFKGSTISSARPVDIHGVPLATDIPIADNTITIDGRYQTYYYEVRRSVPCSVYLARSQLSELSPVTPPLGDVFLTVPSPDGITLNASAALAQVPYICGFTSSSPDPDPAVNPLVFYQMAGAGAGPVNLVKDVGLASVRVSF